MATAQDRQHRARARNRHLPFWHALFTLLISMFLGLYFTDVQAQVTLDVRVGFNDQFVPDQYTPIRIEIIYQGPPLTGELVLHQEIRRSLRPVQTLELRRAIQLGQAAHQLHTLYFPLSAAPTPEADEPEFVVVLTTQGQEITSRRVKLTDAIRTDPFVLAVSDVGFPRVLPTGERVEQVKTEELPSDWKGFSSVRRLYLGRFHANALTLEQQVALLKWLTRGGELVVLTGENFYLQDTPWLREILPLDVHEIRQVEALGVPVAVGQAQGEVLHAQAELPLLVRGSLGQGSVYVSALDLWEPGTVQRLLWMKLTPETAELPRPSPLGVELFRQMELQFPPKTTVGALLVLYATGFGLLSLWVLRRPCWLAGRESSAWRVFFVTLGWIGLFSGLTLVYVQKPEFTRRAQSLEVGWILGSDRTPWAWMRSWYGVFPKRELSFEWSMERDALVLPQESTSLALHEQPDRLGIGISPTPLQAWKPQYLYAEELVPLEIQLEADESPKDVRNPVVRVYNASRWTLSDATLLQKGIYYSLGDLSPGKAREVALTGMGANSWLNAVEGASGQLGFEGRAKQQLYSSVRGELRHKEENYVLLAWIKEERPAPQPYENRWTLKLLLIESAKRG